MKIRFVGFLLLAAGGSAVGCGTSAGVSAPALNVGKATAFLSVVPAAVSCVEIDVAGARAVTQRFDVTANEAAVLSLTGLPLGDDTFTGLAYPTACAAVTSAVQATWISDPTPATLADGIVTDVSLSLHPNGQASVGVGFQPDPEDSGTDAATAPDASAVDSGPPLSFTNPLQIGGLPFNVSTVGTLLSATPLTPMDGSNFDFVSQTVALTYDATGLGLPDDASFAGDGVTIPSVQLSWNTQALNTVFVPAGDGSTGTAPFQFSIPPHQYDQVQIYATSTEGASTLSYTLSYASGAVTSAVVTVPDWCVPGTLGAGVATLTSANRLGGVTFDAGHSCSIYAINLNPDPTRTLTAASFSTNVAGGVTTNLAFYGATGW